jgi:hypothetical protein
MKPVLKTEINGPGDPLRWPRDTLYPQKLALASLTSGGCSVGIVRLRTTTHGVFSFSTCTKTMDTKQTRLTTTFKGKTSFYTLGSEVGIRAGRPKGRSSSSDRAKNFLFSTSSRPALGPTQHPIAGIKQKGREAEHSTPASDEVKKMWIYTSTSPYAFMA